MLTSKFKLSFFVGASLMASTSLTHAEVTAQAVADAVIASMQGQGKTVITVESSEMSGNNILLKGVAAKSEDGNTTTIGDVSLENVSETAESFKVEKLSGGEINFAEKDSTVKVANWTITNANLQKNGQPNSAGVPLGEDISVGPVDMTMQGNQVMHIDGVKWTMSPVTENAPMDVDFKISGINLDLSKSPDQSSKATLEALGLQTIKGDIKAVGSWNPVDGRLLLKEQSFDFANIGRLNLTLDISGYTADVSKQINNTLKLVGNKDASTAAGFSMLGIAQKLTFNQISLRFDDASITNRVLEYMAKQSGTTREAYVAQLKAMAPMMVMQLPEPSLQASWTEATSKFLDNPKSFEIKSVQTSPIPLEKMMVGAMALPELIKSLGITITAE
jgi:hypothetical protein